MKPDLHQTSLRTPVRCSGVGLHGGKQVSLALLPAPAGSGIIFRRTDIEGEERARRIPALYTAAQDLFLCTGLANEAGANIATVEHLVAALYGCGVDNVIVELSGDEVPVFDGSAKVWCEMIEEAGIAYLPKSRTWMKMLAPVEVSAPEEKYAALLPNEAEAGDNALELDVFIDFPDPAIGKQRIECVATPDVFRRELASARTFGFKRDLEALHKQNRALGASLENTIGIEDGAVLNPEGLRFADEFVRHKALDALGDIALAGIRVMGRFVSKKGGHALTSELLHRLFAEPEKWRVETVSGDTG